MIKSELKIRGLKNKIALSLINKFKIKRIQGLFTNY